MSTKKPTHLKLLEGNPGKRAINHTEPVPEFDLIDAPPDLTEGAKRAWEYIIVSSPKGMLKTLDLGQLKLWVVAFDIYNSAYAAVKNGGLVVLSDTGKPMKNPYLQIMDQQAAIMTTCADRLGFTPTARSKIHAGAGLKQDPKEKFGIFKGSNAGAKK